MPLRDAHVRHLDVSSFLGPASGVERWIGSTTRRRGAIGGEFLRQGFAYAQLGGRERGGAAGRLGLWRRCVEGAPPALFIYRGGRLALAPPQALGRRPKEGGVGGKFPPSRSFPRVSLGFGRL